MKYWRSPLDQEKVKPIYGQTHVIPDRCKGCGFCINFCPRHVLKESPEFNLKGYHFPYAANPADCTGCGLCELLCPDFAITANTVDQDEEEASDG
ncbi:MAG: ferredoxin family protein [Dehalococcoidia bacterium]|nr:ferredoxin family protein [Dehalococcoidia bacterium]